MAEIIEVERLRALLTVMREGNLARLVASDGTTLEAFAPYDAQPSAREAQTMAPAPAAVVEADDDAGDDGSEDRELERRWVARWQAVTASSGAPIPAFPGHGPAMRFLGRDA